MCMTLKNTRLTGVNYDCALSSAVEHFLHTEGVAGSKPAARTILTRNKIEAAWRAEAGRRSKSAQDNAAWRKSYTKNSLAINGRNDYKYIGLSGS